MRPKPYRAVVRTPDGREVSKAFARKIDARSWLTVQESSLLDRDWVDPRAGRLVFGEWAESVLAGRVHVAASTRARVDTAYRCQVAPFFARLPVGRIRPEHVRSWIAGLEADGLAPATITKAYQVLMIILRAAVDEQLIPRLPTAGVHLPALGTDEMRFLTEDEVTRLASVMPDWAATLTLTGAYSGCRWGELVGLRRSNLDLERGRLTVIESLSEVDGHLEPKKPKSRAGQRSVTLPGELCDILAGHLESADGELVFPAEQGGFLRRSNFRRRVWLPAVRASVGEPMRFHDLRHTHAAFLIALGAHPKAIQERLGHANIRTTLDRYGHLMVGLDEHVAEALNERLAAQALRNPDSPARLRVVK